MHYSDKLMANALLEQINLVANVLTCMFFGSREPIGHILDSAQRLEFFNSIFIIDGEFIKFIFKIIDC